eukprot:c28289_g2_i3 orf=323-2077(-)
MEEEKAAAYYDELVLKGGAAARFKQGLGFARQSGDAIRADTKDAYFSMSNFVKSESLNEPVGVGEEKRIENVGQDGSVLRQQSRQGDALFSASKSAGFDALNSPQSPKISRILPSSDRNSSPEKEENRLGKSIGGHSGGCSSRFRSSKGRSSERYRLESSRRQDRERRHTSHKRASCDRGVGRSCRSPNKSSHSRRHTNASGSACRRKGADDRSRDRNNSSSLSSGSSLSIATRRSIRKRRDMKRGSSWSSSGYSTDSQLHGKRSSSRSSTSSLSNSSLSAHRKTLQKSRTHVSRRRRSLPRPENNMKHSGSRLRHRLLHRANRSRSPSGIGSARTSDSPPSRRKGHDRKERKYTDSSGRRERDQSSASPGRKRTQGCMVDGDGKSERKVEPARNVSGHLERPVMRDFSKLIQGYDSMTPAEKVKAKIRMQLSETVAKDTTHMGMEWERFDFNREAPLDGDAELSHFGDVTGGCDDTSFLQNTGSTFLSSDLQARREAQTQAAHETAIFGVPVNPSTFEEDDSCIKDEQSGLTRENATVYDEKSAQRTSSRRGFISEQVFLMQQKSWRERALKTQDQRASYPGT